MIRIMLAGVLALLVVGCRNGTLVVESDHREPVRSSYDDRYWDGHVWVMSSDPGRGHYRHHGYWHLYPETHVYSEPHYAHFGVTVQPVRVEERGHHDDHRGHR